MDRCYGGGGGIIGVTGTAPIQIGGTAQEPDVSIDPAVANINAGSISAADQAKLDGIEAGAELNTLILLKHILLLLLMAL